MGKATIVSGGTDGLYTVKLDYGKAHKDAAIARINARLAVLAEEIPAATIKLSAQQAIEDAQKVVVEQSISAFVSVSKTLPRNEANVAKALQDHGKEAAKLMEEKGKTGPLRLALEILKDEQVGLQRELDRWLAIVVEEERDAWCADFTEDATGSVATIDVPGESAQILIAPSAPAPTASDGQLVAREVQAPGQVFWNAAVLPGWQMHMPTFRVGVITSMNPDETANVTLDEAKSSAQKLGINKVTELDAVPIEYMECNATVFEVGDHVVVQFDERDWSKPKIVGFASNPKACGGGFVFRPTNSVQTFATLADYMYWGKPFSAELEPLGTPKGSHPYIAIQPKFTSGALSGAFKKARGINGEMYGQIDWQGANPQKDVLSWMAQTWDNLTFSASGVPTYTFNKWDGSTADDPNKALMMVRRRRSMGIGNSVFSKLRVVKTFDGIVVGACYTSAIGARALVAVLKVTTGSGVQYRFTKAGLPDVTIGTFTVPTNTEQLHCWYFNRSGTRARSTFISKTEWFSVEATLSSGGVTFAEVPGSRNAPDGEAYLYRTEFIWDGGTRTGIVSGEMQDRSPAWLADFIGDEGVVAYMRLNVESPPSHIGVLTDDGGSTRTYTQSSSSASISTSLVMRKDDGSEEVAPIWRTRAPTYSLEQTEVVTYNASAGGYSTTITEDSTTLDPGEYARVSGWIVDIDVRHQAVLLCAYKLGPSPSVKSRSVTTNDWAGGGNSEEYTATVTRAENNLCIDTISGAASASSPIQTYEASSGTDVINYSGPADGSSGGMFDVTSPITGFAQPSDMQRCKLLYDWQRLIHSLPDVNGCIRTYYGASMSSTVSYGDSYASHSTSHVIGLGATHDADVLASIEAQPFPWLAKLGVY